MPAYNSAAFIAEAIESILNQTLRDLELLIVDDGSTDATLAIARSYAERDPRVKVIESNHGGPSQALNKGIELAKTNWVAVMHADDVSLPGRLEKQLAAAQTNPKVVAWGAYAYHISSLGKVLSVSRTGPTTESEFHELRQGGNVLTIIHPAALLNKEIVQTAGGYDPRFDCAEDLELFDRMADYGPILAIPEPLLLYRVHGASNTMSRFFKEKFFTRFVRARLRAKLDGVCQPTLEEFAKQYRQESLARRLRRFLDDSSKFYYRRSGLAFGNRQYLRAPFFFAASVLLNPRYALPRIYRQKFSPVANLWLRSRDLR
jgi:glycosyltransferase involved in cell wall biosynthesis